MCTPIPPTLGGRSRFISPLQEVHRRSRNGTGSRTCLPAPWPHAIGAARSFVAASGGRLGARRFRLATQAVPLKRVRFQSRNCPIVQVDRFDLLNQPGQVSLIRSVGPFRYTEASHARACRTGAHTQRLRRDSG